MSDDLYEKLAAPFDEVGTLSSGGREFSYLTGEQVTARLNEVLGVMGWSFRVLSHGYIEETDEEWCHGQLMIVGIAGEAVIHEQFGSQRRNKKRDGVSYIEIGMDKKGAATDALKKCATQIGVGLYLTERKPVARRQARQTDTSGLCATCGKNAKVPGGGMTGGRYFCPEHKP